MKNLDITHGCSILWVSSSLGVPLTLGRVGGPQLEGLDPTHESPSQFELDAAGRVTVASQLSLTPDKTNWLLKFSDSQGWRNPGNGLLLDAATNAYVPVVEKNKPYLAIRRKTSLSLVLKG
jgi:hypothetical protein